MIPVLIEVLDGRSPSLVLPRRRSVPWREVREQGPRAAVQPTRRSRAVQMLSMVEVAIHPPHDPIEHVARAMPAGVAVRDRPAIALVAQVQQGLQDHPRQMAQGPLPEPTQVLRETPAVGGTVRLPDPPRDLREDLLQMLGSVPDPEPGMQEAEEDDNLREQGLPGRWRPRPAVGADRGC